MTLKKQDKYGLIPLKNSNVDLSANVHIFVNGFMSDEYDESLFLEWMEGFRYIIPSSDKLYLFKWDSGLDYSKIKNYVPFNTEIKQDFKKIINLAIGKIHPFLTVASLPIFFLDEWKTANLNSIKYGEILAKDLKKLTSKKIYLYGHSLGTNLLRNTLMELHKENIFVEKVFLFGGASCSKDINEWSKICNITKKGIYNFYTKNDWILNNLYKLAEFNSKPIGLEPLFLDSTFKIFNYDVSYTVNGHFDYKKNLPTIFRNLNKN